MNYLIAFFRRIRSGSANRPEPRNDDEQLRRLHQRLVAALSEGEPRELVEILAEDVQLRLERKVYEGRANMLLAFHGWLGLMQIDTSIAHVSLLAADVATIAAQWIFDCPERGNFAEQMTCLCVRRGGDWRVVQLRQEAALAT